MKDSVLDRFISLQKSNWAISERNSHNAFFALLLRPLCFSGNCTGIWVRNAWKQICGRLMDSFLFVNVGATRQSPVDVLKFDCLKELSALPAPWQVLERGVYYIRDVTQSMWIIWFWACKRSTSVTDKANILKQPLKRNILKMCFILFVHFLFSDCLLKPGFQLEEDVIDNEL